uniref:Uncharacterized protein n=1 Tax=Calidris pygmaea TaxID=425635 RepID=A0A8C3JCQ0_9CHAR
MEVNTSQTFETTHSTKRWTLIIAIMGLWSGTVGAWDQNSYIQMTKSVVDSLNLSDCWVCTALPKGNLELPLLGIPVSYANWSWPYDNLNNSTPPTGDSIVWKVGGGCAPNQRQSRLPNGETLCWGHQSPIPPKGHEVPRYTCGNSSIYPLKFDLQILERPIFIKRHNNTAPKVGDFNLDLTADLNGTVCERGRTINDSHGGCPQAVIIGLWLNYSYSCIPDGLWWLCGDGHARKSLPDYWDGVCTLGYVIPQNRIYNHSHLPPGIMRTHWRKVREIPNNPLAERPSAFHSFARWLFAQLGVSELEKAIVNISATMEKIENLTVDAIQGLQTEVSSLGKMVLQNRMALDLIKAKEGGVCLIINQSCCSYINQEKRIETDIARIWQQSKVLHQVSQDDTSLGFSDLWEKLTSWLPNFAWLVLLLTIISLGFIVCILFKCFPCCAKRATDDYELWKKHQLRQKIKSGKYFKKCLEKESIL